MAFGKSKEPERDPGSQASPSRGPDSLIARGMVLAGDCETDGELRIDGHVRGSVRAARLTVGAGGRIDGDVKGEGSGADRTIRIDGRVGGEVRARRVEIGPEASVGSGLIADEATVRGHVKGTVRAETRLLLEETAVVEGDVTARRLGLKEGGQVFGTIRIGERPEGGPGAG